MLCRAILSLFFLSIVGSSTIITHPTEPKIHIVYADRTKTGICRTAHSHQKQYSGYLKIPPNSLDGVDQDYPMNLFFWFIQARGRNASSPSPENAPLTLWTPAHPADSSMMDLFAGNGPCRVMQESDGTFKTEAREWGWDRISNLLFLDQRNHVGYSYDEKVNQTVDLVDGHFVNPAGEDPLWRYAQGNFSTENARTTANSSSITAQTTWHFLQTFLTAFPEYKVQLMDVGSENSPNMTYHAAEIAGINLFGVGHAGTSIPLLAEYIAKQNNATDHGILPNTTIQMKVESVGIFNGLIDRTAHYRALSAWWENNTYNMDLINKTQIPSVQIKLRGCLAQIEQCKNMTSSATTDAQCLEVIGFCKNLLDMVPHDRQADIRLGSVDHSQSSAVQEYLNSYRVTSAVGSHVNFTSHSRLVRYMSDRSVESLHANQTVILSKLLRDGTRVALVYGDADYELSWYSGERIAHEIAHHSGYEYRENFDKNGWSPVFVNVNSSGADARQHANLTFVRLFDAGRDGYMSQPEAAFIIFSRVVTGRKATTGVDYLGDKWYTEGERSSKYQNRITQHPGFERSCWVRGAIDCSDSEVQSLRTGPGYVRNGIFSVNESSDTFRPEALSERRFIGNGVGSYVAADKDASEERRRMDKRIGKIMFFVLVSLLGLTGLIAFVMIAWTMCRYWSHNRLPFAGRETSAQQEVVEVSEGVRPTGVSEVDQTW